jgi:hypothetical protein
MGFKIFGTFGKLPGWAEDKPEKTNSPGGWSSYPPKDLEAWDKYVVETAKAFAPYIDTWETWNEPDSEFLVTTPGYKMSKEEIVVSLAARTRAALDKAGLKYTLIGPAVADVSRAISRGVLRMNMTQYLDYQSFHCYGLGQVKIIENEMRQWTELKNVKGQPIEWWQSEGGITTSDIHTWLKTTGNVTDSGQMGRDVAATVKLMAVLKAHGVKKNFQYAANAQPSGSLVYRNIWRNIIDVNGIPMPAMAAHAAAVYFLEGTQDVEYGQVEVGNATVSVCKFTRNGKPLELVWSSAAVNLQKVIQAVGASRPQAFDVMANPLPVAADTILGDSPVYLVE